jgi:hypothetical protein
MDLVTSAAAEPYQVAIHFMVANAVRLRQLFVLSKPQRCSLPRNESRGIKLRALEQVLQNLTSLSISLTTSSSGNDDDCRDFLRVFSAVPHLKSIDMHLVVVDPLDRGNTDGLRPLNNQPTSSTNQPFLPLINPNGSTGHQPFTQGLGLNISTYVRLVDEKLDTLLMWE